MQDEQYTRTKGEAYGLWSDSSRDHFYDPVISNWRPWRRHWSYPHRGWHWRPYYGPRWFGYGGSRWNNYQRRSSFGYAFKLVATTIVAAPIVILELAALLRFIFQP